MKNYNDLNKGGQQKYRVGLRKKLFYYWSIFVRERDGECYLCKSKTKLQAHHLFSRQFYKSLRYDVLNGVTLCASCHRFKGASEYGSMHHSPLAVFKWIEEHKSTYEYLVANLHKEVDYDDIDVLERIQKTLKKE